MDRKRGREETLRKTNIREHFSPSPCSSPAKAQSSHSQGMQYSQREKLKGSVISILKVFCNLGWNGMLSSFFLSSSGLTTTTAKTS